MYVSMTSNAVVSSEVAKSHKAFMMPLNASSAAPLAASAAPLAIWQIGGMQGNWGNVTS